MDDAASVTVTVTGLGVAPPKATNTGSRAELPAARFAPPTPMVPMPKGLPDGGRDAVDNEVDDSEMRCAEL